MSKLQKIKFPLDGKTFNTKQGLFKHIEENYSHLLVKDKYGDDITPGRLYFNLKYKKQYGRCVVSGKDTKWNESTQRYERFYSEKEAKIYREEFKARMLKKYGKVHLLDSPEQQGKMLSNRGTTSFFEWNDGSKTEVISTNERKFLEMLNDVYKFNSTMVTQAPTIYYEFNGNKKFYMPDFFIPSMNLIIEVKATQNGYQKDNMEKEKAKAKAAIKEGYSFIQINDNDFTEFHLLFIEFINKEFK